MGSSTELRKAYLGQLGKALVNYGFPPAKKALRYNFVRSTPVGKVAIFANPITHGNEIRFSLDVGVRINRVQERMETTELFAPEARGETWSCSAMLENLEKFKGWIAPLTPLRQRLASVGLGPRTGGFAGYDQDYMNFTATEATIKSKVERATKQIEALAIQFFQLYGETEEGFLDLCVRDDDFADVCWLTLDKKVLCGLIVAKFLGHQGAKDRLLEIAQKKGGYFARKGNPVPLERIYRIGADLGVI